LLRTKKVVTPDVVGIEFNVIVLADIEEAESESKENKKPLFGMYVSCVKSPPNPKV
jgi:hypothetical protein